MTADEFDRQVMKDMEAINNGEMTIPEYKRRQFLRSRNFWLPEMHGLAKSGKWEKFVDYTLVHYEIMPDAFRLYYDDVPDNLKYNFAIEAYSHHGDSMAVVRKAVRNARKYGEPILPEEIAISKVITVYRAGEEPIHKAKYRISWTIDPEVALFFFDQWRNAHAEHLYRGKIKTSKIIAFNDDRHEKEIMQYGNVYDIQEIKKDDITEK